MTGYGNQPISQSAAKELTGMTFRELFGECEGRR